MHQRKYPKSVSRGRTPWRPPAQLKCADSFPAATYDGVGGSSAASGLVLTGSGQPPAPSECLPGQEVGAWHRLNASFPRAIPSQAPYWGTWLAEKSQVPGRAPHSSPPSQSARGTYAMGRNMAGSRLPTLIFVFPSSSMLMAMATMRVPPTAVISVTTASGR